METKGGFNFRTIWGISMVLIYITIAILLIFTDVFAMNKSVRLIVGVVFFLYAVFRGINVLKFGK